jgi:acylpyruvate hydrolase
LVAVSDASQIVAIGRNYAAHAKELGNAAPKEPFFFLKPTTSYVHNGGRVEIPRGIDAHHEGAHVLVSDSAWR